jgi:hypothetical protein
MVNHHSRDVQIEEIAVGGFCQVFIVVDAVAEVDKEPINRMAVAAASIGCPVTHGELKIKRPGIKVRGIINEDAILDIRVAPGSSIGELKHSIARKAQKIADEILEQENPDDEEIYGAYASISDPRWMSISNLPDDAPADAMLLLPGDSIVIKDVRSTVTLATAFDNSLMFATAFDNSLMFATAFDNSLKLE